MASQLDPPFIRTEFKLDAEFTHRAGGTTEFKDVVGISATFALNDIPTATLNVATGTEVRDETKATIHTALEKLKPRDAVKVWLTLKSTQGFRNEPIINGMKDGRYLIFEGYYSGIGYQRAYNNCSYSIHLVHWLDDLNCSSMLNGDWSTNMPGDLAATASEQALDDLSAGAGVVVGPGGRGGAVGARAVQLIDRESPSHSRAIITPQNLTTDLWEKVIKRIFTNLTAFKHPLFNCTGTEPGDGKPATNNEAARAALDRMPGKVPPQYKAKLPLNLEGFMGDNQSHIAFAIHQGLNHIILDGAGYSSFWSKLIGEIAPSFLCAVSPSVEFAQVVPFFPGLNKPHVVIGGEEYNYANFNANSRSLLSMIIIRWATQSSSGVPVSGGNISAAVNYCRPLGWYPKTNRDHWGNILVRDPPAWLVDRTYQILYPKPLTLDPNVGSTCVPGNGENKNPVADKTPREVDKDHKDRKTDIDGEDLSLADRLACHWYKSSILGQRYGELSGKLRFDIAPGSIVKIEPPVTAIENEKTAMFGAVVQVSFVINAEQHTAGTSFAFSHLRTETENNIDIPHSKKHFVGTVAPLYKKEEPGSPWAGAPLAEAGGFTADDAPTDAGGFAPGFGGFA